MIFNLQLTMTSRIKQFQAAQERDTHRETKKRERERERERQRYK